MSEDAHSPKPKSDIQNRLIVLYGVVFTIVVAALVIWLRDYFFVVRNETIERNVLQTEKIDCVTDRFDDALRARIADCGVPITNANKSALRCKLFHQCVGQIALGITCAFEPAVRQHGGCARQRQYILNHRRRCVRDIDNHVELIGTPYDCSTELAQTLAACSMQ